MKRTFLRIAALTTVFAAVQLTATSRLAAAQNSTPPAARAQVAAPKVIASKSTLSADEMAKYRAKSAESRPAATDKAAGASSNKTVWIVVGVAAVAGAVALASSGGGGGGGY
jgi:hypothetical protein